MRNLLKQKMAAVVRETCSCAVDVVLLEVTCLNSTEGTMKWQLIGPSAGAVVEYVVNKNPNGHMLASNLTVQPCQDTCYSQSPIHGAGVTSDVLNTAISVASIVGLVAIVTVVVVPVLRCYCKKNRKRRFSPNAMSPQLVRNPMYCNVAPGDEERGQAELEEPPVLPPQFTQVPAEPSSPIVINDTKGYSKLQHFHGSREPPEVVQLQITQEAPTDEASIADQSLISENQGSLDAALEVEDVADDYQSGATADGTLVDGSLGDDTSGHPSGSAPISGDMAKYTVRPFCLQTRSQSSDSDGSASYIGNSPDTEAHLTVPPRILRTDPCLEEEGEEDEEVFSGSSKGSKNETKRQGKPPMPLPRRRNYSQEIVVENEEAYDEPPPTYENVVLSKS